MARVIIIDDEKGIRFTLREFLADENHDVVTAENGEEALELVQAKTFDVVVTDLILPDIHGVDLLRKIRLTQPDVQAIVITGEPNVETAVEAVRFNAFDYLYKPVTRQAICRVVQNAADVKHLSDENKRLFEENERQRHKLEELVQERTQKLQDSEEMYRNLVELADDGICIVQDNKIRYANSCLAKLLGYEAKELFGRDYTDFIPPDHRQPLSDMMEKHVAGERDMGIQELELVRADGTVIFAELSSSIVHHNGKQAELVIVRDISMRVLADNALKDSEERYRQLVINSPVGILSTDLKGDILNLNPMLLKLLGSPSARATRNINMLKFEPLVQAGIAADFKRCIDSGESFVAENPYITKWGKPTHLRYHLTPLRDANDDMIGLQAIVEDVSEQRESEREQIRLEKQLRKVQNFKEIGNLTADLAHEFTNILTSIAGHTEMLQINLEKGEDAGEEIEEINRALRRAITLTRQLQSFRVRPVAEDENSIEINEILASLHQSLQNTLGSRGMLAMQLDPRPCYVRVDEGQFCQFIRNITGTASKSMSRSGNFWIETRIQHPSLGQDETANGEPAEHRVVITMRDNGTGFTEDELKSIFDAESSKPDPKRLRGLGLATAKWIVTHNRGEFFVNSVPGRGTTVTITFPLVIKDLESLQPLDKACLPERPKTILMVEDDPTVSNLVNHVLVDRGYKVLFSNNSPEALELADTYDGPIDLLLADVMLKPINGIEMAQTIRKKRNDIRIVYMSGYSIENFFGDEAIGNDVDFLQKPFSIENLTSTIHRLLLDA